MSSKRRVAVRVVLFAMLGLVMEVLFTASAALLLHGDWNMRGHTSPWMMLDYGILGVAVSPMSAWLKRRRIPLPARAAAYMLGIFLVELVSGEIFTALGLRIWDYSTYPLNFRGQITLVYAPFWYALGMGLETLHRWIDLCAAALTGSLLPGHPDAKD